MAKVLPKPGTYLAKRSKPIVVNETQNGALMAYVSYDLLNADIAFGGVHGVVLGKIDGTLMTKTIENLKLIFPSWNGQDPFELQDVPMPEVDGAEFELADCYIDDTYVPANSTDGQPVLQFRANWINVVGGRGPEKPTEPEVEGLRKKWGAKFKAISAAPAKAPAAAPAAEKPAPAKKVPASRPAPAAPKAARSETAESVWLALVKKHEGESEDDVAQNRFYPAQDKLFGQGIAASTPEKWGEVADALGV